MLQEINCQKGRQKQREKRGDSDTGCLVIICMLNEDQRRPLSVMWSQSLSVLYCPLLQPLNFIADLEHFKLSNLQPWWDDRFSSLFFYSIIFIIFYLIFKKKTALQWVVNGCLVRTAYTTVTGLLSVCSLLRATLTAISHTRYQKIFEHFAVPRLLRLLCCSPVGTII